MPVEFDNETLQTFASRIKELRMESELSAEALGNYLGYSRSSISCYENATRVPDIKVLTAYANFFDVSIDYLVGKSNIRKTLYSIACFSDISTDDLGNLSEGAQEDIKKYIQYVMFKEKNNK